MGTSTEAAITTTTAQTKNAPAIDLEKILVVRRLSKFELEQRRLGCSEADLEAKYTKGGTCADPVLESHRYYMRQLENLKQALGSTRVIERDNIDANLIASNDVIISLGGDDHFKYVAQFAEGKLIVAVNSDPWRSDGALTSCMIEELPQLLQALAAGKYKIENWTRLEALIDGKTLGQAISEIRLGEQDVDDMSHHRLCDQVRCAEQKGSGLLIATGAGSTGWIKSAGRYQFPKGNAFGRTEEKARYMLREPHEGRLLKEEMWHGEITSDQTLSVESLNNGEAVVSFDAVKKVPFPRGSKVTIKISDHPLKVVTFDN